MTNTYYRMLTTSFADWLGSFKAALLDRYGEGVTINSQSTSEIVFTCPAISEKSIKLVTNFGYFGKISNGSFASEQTFAFHYYGSFSLIPHLVLGDTFLLLSGYTDGMETSFLVAKTQGGVSLCCFGVAYNSASRYQNCRFFDATNNKDIDFVDFAPKVCYCDTGIPYKAAVTVYYPGDSGDQLLRKPDGSEDTVDGLYITTRAGSTLLVSGGLFSASQLYTVAGYVHLYSSLLAEF